MTAGKIIRHSRLVGIPCRVIFYNAEVSAGKLDLVLCLGESPTVLRYTLCDPVLAGAPPPVQLVPLKCYLPSSKLTITAALAITVASLPVSLGISRPPRTTLM